MTDRERMLAVWKEPCVLRARERLRADSPSILETQVAVSEIPSPTGQEDARADWLLDRFREASLTGLRRDGAGNVIGVRPGSDPGSAPVVLCAHLDTVFPPGMPVSVRRDGRRLVGPGIGDNGRGLAALVALAGVIDGVALRPRAPVVFVGTTGEEGSGDLRGAKHLFANGLGAARAAVILDGAGDDRIVHRALGSRRFRIEFRGPGGHSWSSYGAPNAVHAAARCAASLAAIALPDTPRTTLSVGRMGGGMSVNAIPADAWLEVDVRSLAAHVLPQLEERIRAAVHAAVREENDGRAPGSSPLASRLAIIGDRPAGETAFDHPLVAAAVEATRLIGREPALAAASTDANVPISLGIPAVAIGAGGRGGDAHTADEWFEDADGGRGLERALAITMAAAGLSAARPAPAEV
ncbi:MAG TPA: M20/M25/M40 family metallo-hydrolase [Gemmatimonadaceae bacterium]|nr:M20/M25/M40 family metallo-hydrolase [Gemmatimonadaceae bacterium]